LKEVAVVVYFEEVFQHPPEETEKYNGRGLPERPAKRPIF
jgi:hypothetical protein